MNYWDWALIVFGVAYLVITLGSLLPAFQRLTVLRLAFNSGIGVPDKLDAALRARTAARARCAGVCGVVVLAGMYGAFHLFAGGLTLASFYLCFAASAVASSFGLAGASLLSESRLSNSPVRLARARSVTVNDYVAQSLRTFAWIIFAVAAVTVAGGTLLASEGVFGAATTAGNFLPPLVIVTASGAGLTIAEAGSLVIVRRGQSAGSTDELIWDDALRSSAIRDLYQAAVWTAYIGVLAAYFLGHNNLDWMAAVACLLTIALAGTFGRLSRRDRTRYLRTLWPGARRRTSEEQAEYLGTEAPVL
jgi:hypothetical protein